MTRTDVGGGEKLSGTDRFGEEPAAKQSVAALGKARAEAAQWETSGVRAGASQGCRSCGGGTKSVAAKSVCGAVESVSDTLVVWKCPATPYVSRCSPAGTRAGLAALIIPIAVLAFVEALVVGTTHHPIAGWLTQPTATGPDAVVAAFSRLAASARGLAAIRGAVTVEAIAGTAFVVC